MYDIQNQQTRYIFLNSSNASTGTLYDFSFVFNNSELTDFFKCDFNEGVFITPVSAVVCADYDEITSTNNTFNIKLPSSTGYYTYPITLTTGSPNVLGLVADLQAQCTATTFNYYNGSTVVSLTITVSFESLYNYIRFTLSATPSTVIFDFSVANNCGQVVGFKPLVYTYTSTNVVNGDFAPDVSRLSEIYIYSDTITVNNYTQYSNDSFSNMDNTQILFSIPVNASTGSNIIFSNPYQHFKQLCRQNIDRIQLSLRDKNGNYVEVNNASTFIFRLDKYETPQVIQTNEVRRLDGLVFR
mgnify:CR=1 FL=1